jgi:predicted RNA binding protein YcfA (HicA-like mRNA interferase family)
MAAIETSTRKIIQRLKADDWISEVGAKHEKFAHPQKSTKIIVPRHRTQTAGVARVIAKVAGWI